MLAILVKKLSREITNRVAGRRCTISEGIEFQDALQQLRSLDIGTKITFTHFELAVFSLFYRNYRDVTPEEIIEYYEREFRPSSVIYSKANHYVFSGNQDEGHYLELFSGLSSGTFGGKERFGMPSKLAFLEYLVSKT